MEKTQVIIVGAGPSGLALGLTLAKFRIHSVILEKDGAITTDPRGVYLTGDAVRICYDLGIGPDLNDIGHVVHQVNFHRSSFAEKPFFTLNQGGRDALDQVVPEGILQSQPRLEKALRDRVSQSEWCTLRTGCTVTSRSCEDPPTIEYVSINKTCQQIQGDWLVGADGKIGIVRKHFLEKSSGIRQQEGVYRYSGTWIAANLKITIPTPKSHPEFPLWALEYTPDAVYDLFWPVGWHFCCPPGKPTAAGRFGPHSDRLWRHELRQDDWNEDMDAEALFWAHITPMITRDNDERSGKFPSPVVYPRDCIEVLRCRPFNFTHKVVNRWFAGRTILIGDAAHVFPPFAGQGIASGLRDAHQLGWRLAMLTKSCAPDKIDPGLSDRVLQSWSNERLKSVNDAALFSKLNGTLCNKAPSFWILGLLWLHNLLQSSPFLPDPPDIQAIKEREGFSSVDDGFFLRKRNGGARLAQIWAQAAPDDGNCLSDCLLGHSKTIFTLIIVSATHNYKETHRQAIDTISCSKIHPDILSEKSIIVYTPDTDHSTLRRASNEDPIKVFQPALSRLAAEQTGTAYSGRAYISRLGRSAKFCLVRPDFFVFACASDVHELAENLSSLKRRIGHRD